MRKNLEWISKKKCLLTAVGAEGSGNFQEDIRDFIQPSPKEETDFYLGYLKHPLGFTWSDDNPLYTVSDACIGCGTCERICPMKCIRMKDEHPEYAYSACLMCLACIQACPDKAIVFASIHEQNPQARCRNENITLNDLFRLNQ